MKEIYIFDVVSHDEPQWLSLRDRIFQIVHVIDFSKNAISSVNYGNYSHLNNHLCTLVQI